MTLKLVIVDDEPTKLLASCEAARALGAIVIPVLQDVRGVDPYQYPKSRLIGRDMEDKATLQRSIYEEPAEAAALQKLEDPAMRLQRAASAYEVVAIAQGSGASAVLTDYNMPWVKGDEMALTCHSAGLQTVIYTSGGRKQDIGMGGQVLAQRIRVVLKAPERNMGLVLKLLEGPQVGRGSPG